MKRLLVTGASGFLGWYICRAAQSNWRVYGTYYQHSINIPGVSLQHLDLSDAEAVQLWLGQIQPEAIIHTAALSQPNRCEQEPEQSYRINVKAARILAQYCGQREIPFAFTSTDQVFNGRSAPYCEIDAPSPINVYGRHKAEAERIIAEAHPAAAICRMPLMYGAATPTAKSFLQGFLRTLKTGQSLRLFIDEYRSPAYAEDAAQGLLLALDNVQGILHLGGPQRLSRYEFGLLMAKAFRLDASLIVPSRQADVPMAAARPADVSSDSRKAFALGYAPRRAEVALATIAQQP